MSFVSHNPEQKIDRYAVIAAAASFILWGLFPLYWNLLPEVSALEVLAHRILWSAVLMVCLVLFSGKIRDLRSACSDSRLLLIIFGAALILSFNWGLYIWGVTHHYVLQCSLGYFINPILNVLLAVILLGERLSRKKTVAIIIAAVGCLVMIISAGEMPWIAFVLAGSFATYSLIRKKIRISSMVALTIETCAVAPLAIGYLLFCSYNDQLSFGHGSMSQNLLMIGAGLVTSVPLLLFGYAAQRIPFSLLGVLQYLSPTGQFLLALFYYHEPFTLTQGVAFILIWLALWIFTADSISQHVDRTQ